MVEAFYVIQRLRLRNQAALQPLADDVANRVDPDRLNGFERYILQWAFRQERTLQKRLALDYQL